MITGTGNKVSDFVALASLPANVALWTIVSDIDILLRILVSVGSLVLIGFSLRAKFHQLRSRQ